MSETAVKVLPGTSVEMEPIIRPGAEWRQGHLFIREPDQLVAWQIVMRTSTDSGVWTSVMYATPVPHRDGHSPLFQQWFDSPDKVQESLEDAKRFFGAVA